MWTDSIDPIMVLWWKTFFFSILIVATLPLSDGQEEVNFSKLFIATKLLETPRDDLHPHLQCCGLGVKRVGGVSLCEANCCPGSEEVIKENNASL